MFKTRKKIAEEEAKQMPDYIPTSELQSDDDKSEQPEKVHFPMTAAIIMGVLIVLIIVCIIVIACLGGK